MKTYAAWMVGLLVVLAVMVPALAEDLDDTIHVGVWPDDRAPYVYAGGTINIATGLCVDWETGVWWYRNEPLNGVHNPFYMVTCEPTYTRRVFGFADVRVIAFIQYRTNMPGHVELSARYEIEIRL